MKTIKKLSPRVSVILLLVLAIVTPTFCQTPSEMFAKGLNMADQAVKDDDMHSLVQGLKIMEKAQKKDKKRADWCYEIGIRYSTYFNWDRKKAIKWFTKGSKLGDIKSALVLYKEYKPKYNPPNIFVLAMMGRKYYKEKDKCWRYAGMALKADIPADFDNYLTLADAAYFTNNADLANKYAAIAAEKKESGALEYLIQDERALEYLKSPEIMFEAARKMWQRNLNDYGHRDKENSFFWFKKAATSGYPLAQTQMGYFQLGGVSILEPDTLKAVTWFKLAANNKETNAMVELARLYINGRGVEKDVERGFILLKECVDCGQINSKLYLGLCNLYGIGTQPNTQYARALFEDYYFAVNRKYANSFQHAPNNRVLILDNRIIDFDYLFGLTYYYEGSPKCIPLFERSLANTTFEKSQRGDLLRKLANCYQEAKWGRIPDKQKSKGLITEAQKYGNYEINGTNIIL